MAESAPVTGFETEIAAHEIRPEANETRFLRDRGEGVGDLRVGGRRAGEEIRFLEERAVSIAALLSKTELDILGVFIGDTMSHSFLHFRPFSQRWASSERSSAVRFGWHRIGPSD